MPRRTRFAGLWTAEQFGRVMQSSPSIEAHTLAALSAVLVDGKEIEAAAEASGLKKQRLFRRLREVVDRYVPEGWEIVTVCLPAAEVVQVRALEKQCRQQLEAGVRTNESEGVSND